jgi:hypothetical protein
VQQVFSYLPLALDGCREYEISPLLLLCYIISAERVVVVCSLIVYMRKRAAPRLVCSCVQLGPFLHRVRASDDS